jgi:hypothetical protein
LRDISVCNALSAARTGVLKNFFKKRLTDKKFADVRDFKKQIQDDWESKIDRFATGIGGGSIHLVEVYGNVLQQKTGEDNNGNAVFAYPVKPLDVKISWAFPEGSVERAKEERLNKLDNYEKKGEQNDL